MDFRGRKVVLTGIGIVAPSGVGHRAFWEALLEGRSLVGPITRFDARDYPSRVAAEVRDRSYEELLDPRLLRTTTLATQFALAAAELALRDARLSRPLLPPESTGVYLGTALGGWLDAEKQFALLQLRGARRVNPFLANSAPHHGTAAQIAAQYGIEGPNLTLTTGCPSSLVATAEAAERIASGELDVCLAGGTEAPVSPLVVGGMTRTNELSVRNEDPEHASCPFDRSHCGLVVAEGACILVLETEERARARGISPYAAVLGGATSCDAQGLWTLDPSGETAARTIHRLFRKTAIQPADLDYVCSHANSSPAFDRKETVVLTKALGEFAARIPVSSIKGVLGHPFGAAGAFQTAAAALALRTGTIPHTHNLEEPDPECQLAHVREHPLRASLGHVLVSSYGYGGLNAYLLLGRADEAG
ncbi:MAG: 3-oxoacyl-[acyl-carrier-protein] synthase 2 [Candidatus Binatia bacterium]|nr:MAG: 3-oxoacyl-[acyl-carrier-protein] synthase 2 [Candidatus Binatia bacterium]